MGYSPRGREESDTTERLHSLTRSLNLSKYFDVFILLFHMDVYIHGATEGGGECECWFSGTGNTFQIKDKMPALLELMF